MLEDGRISWGQLFILMVVFITGLASNLTSDFALVRQDGVIANLLVIPFSIVTFLIIQELQRRHPGQTPYEYGKTILGRWGGILIGIVYMYITIEISMMLPRVFGEFVVTVLTPEIPVEAYTITMVLVGVYVVYAGIEAIARFTQMAFPIYVFILVFINFFLIRQAKIENVFPFFDNPVGEIAYATYLQYVFPMGEVVLFSSILPYVRGKRPKFFSPLLAIVISGFYLAYRVFITVGVLGKETVGISTYPFIQAIRFIKIGEFIERLDLLFLGIYIMITVVEFSLIFYMLVQGVAQMTGIKDRKAITFPLGLLIIGLSQVSISNTLDQTRYMSEVRFLTSPIWMFIIPLLLLVISRIRFGKRNTSGGQQAVVRTDKIQEVNKIQT
ncbi:spore germination protein (amino acid permease) [Aneurinibacillus soli]|uniref:Spore germination protein YndE n=1 Tax=Aneurinibacillus soli TaxID=1500254 RepID=A0A0U5B725_9BACL|nr:endospore germination permease [Aneurinibacillus soli]PYE59262.1 spore germination protein (amino acid permease) [Aneurinibacillus soli]BAU26748.1 Spore germination protein YndE [Aneurinibacillus soli]